MIWVVILGALIGAGLGCVIGAIVALIVVATGRRGWQDPVTTVSKILYSFAAAGAAIIALLTYLIF